MRQRTLATRRKVLDSATVVFARRGYAGASVDELLRATGLSKPTLYYHFGSKEGLFRAILDFAYDESYRRMEAGARVEGGCAERLVAVVAALFGFAGEYRELCRLVLGTVFAAPEEVPPKAIDPARRRRAFELFAAVIRDGRREGVLRERFTVAELARGVMGVALHQIRLHLLQPQGPLDRRAARRTVRLFLEGAQAPR